MAEVVLPDPDAAGWRVAATAMATDLYAMLIRHPWLMQASGSYLFFGPGRARHDDHSFAIYEAAGFTGQHVEHAVATVFTFVLGHAIGPAGGHSLRRKLGRNGGDVEESLRANVARAVEVANRFPRLRAHLESTTVEFSGAPAGSFEFGLEVVLDGLEARVRA